MPIYVIAILFLTLTGKTFALPNPASENCIKQGGKLVIEKREDGGEYGVCFFEDNRQCEEWALYRKNCPVGGVKVTGYTTPQARYCAITGGKYTMLISETKDSSEIGVCLLPDGHVCDSLTHYFGDCS